MAIRGSNLLVFVTLLSVLICRFNHDLPYTHPTTMPVSSRPHPQEGYGFDTLQVLSLPLLIPQSIYNRDPSTSRQLESADPRIPNHPLLLFAV